ncbi:MAG: DUF1206 domain-containing protein [Chloroflexi bacterium]|nr:MAG: DUF1206 domain-containing protein [Chloroflexota bacterium]
MATVQANANSVKHEAKRAAANPGLELLERLGYIVRGALYIAMGILALRIALSKPDGRAVDLTGSVVVLISNQFGKLLLLMIIVGLAAYSVWGLIRAFFDPLHRGSDPSGYIERLGFVSSAISYALIVVFGFKILAGSGGGSTDSTRKAISSILEHPAGGSLTVLIGLIALGVGLGQFVEAYRAVFMRDLKGAEISDMTRRIVTGLGRFGMFARGVIFVIVGWFIVQAGLHHDPGKVQGFDGAFLFLLTQPFGHLVLGVVALGIVALGLHSLACARWVRLMGSPGSA